MRWIWKKSLHIWEALLIAFKHRMETAFWPLVDFYITIFGLDVRHIVEVISLRYPIFT
jgi:hypothetical protein